MSPYIFIGPYFPIVGLPTPSPQSIPQTFGDMINDVLRQLGLKQDTTSLTYTASNGQIVVNTPFQIIADKINEGVAEICRRCSLYYLTRTITTTGGQRFVMATDNTPFSNVNRVTVVEVASFNGVQLQESSTTGLENYNQGKMLTAWNGTDPLYMFPIGPGGIGLHPIPPTSGTLYVEGYGIPAAMVNLSDPSPLVADMNGMAVDFACGRVAMLLDRNPDVKARGPLWIDSYERDVNRQLILRWAEDPKLAARLYAPVVPTAPGQALTGQQVSMGTQQGQQM